MMKKVTFVNFFIKTYSILSIKYKISCKMDKHFLRYMLFSEIHVFSHVYLLIKGTKKKTIFMLQHDVSLIKANLVWFRNLTILNFLTHITKYRLILSFTNCFVAFLFHLLYVVLACFFILYTNWITGRTFTSEMILTMFLCWVVFGVMLHHLVLVWTYFFLHSI